MYFYKDNVFKNSFASAKWLPRLEQQIEKNSDVAHEDYRVFISAEPPPSPDQHVIPQGILENSIKITSEPPTGMFANLHAALNNFNQVSLFQLNEAQKCAKII